MAHGSAYETKAVPLAELDLHRGKDELKRYLDATRSAMLFGPRVVLVEGIAEALLMPAFARRVLRRPSQRHCSGSTGTRLTNKSRPLLTRSALIVASASYTDPGLCQLRAPGSDADAFERDVTARAGGGVAIEAQFGSTAPPSTAASPPSPRRC